MRALSRCGFYSKLTGRSATVALSGEGADEILGGYLTYRANRLSRVISGDRGTMTTRSAPPDWAAPSEVIKVALPKGDSESIWIEFRSLADRLKAAGPEFYDAIGMKSRP